MAIPLGGSYLWKLRHGIHRIKIVNYQFNRWHSPGYCRLENLIAAASRVILDMNTENLHSDRVTQDVLLLTGAEDHFGQFNMHLKLHRMQIEALTSARSVTDRIFTREEHAQNHCQVGNIGLALDVMASWLEDVS